MIIRKLKENGYPPQNIYHILIIKVLKNLVEFLDYNIIYSMADYPIDFDLFVEHTNYYKNKDVGKHSHLKRIRVMNFLCNISIEKTNEYYDKLCKLGCGREIYMFLNKK